MTESTSVLHYEPRKDLTQERCHEPSILCDKFDNSSQTVEEPEELPYRYHASNSSDTDDTDDEDDEDPYQELFMNAYRSAPPSSEDEEEHPTNNFIHPDAKPLSLMEDWELWDYMDEKELKERLKDHPRLLEEITRKRKRRVLEEEVTGTSIDDELSDVMIRSVKCGRTDPSTATK